MYRPLTFLDSLLVAPILLLPLLSTAVAEPLRCGPDPQCRFHLDRGIALDREQKYELALAEFQAAYRRQPDPWVAVNVGRTFHKLGRFAEALSWYRDAGYTSPADVELQKQLLEFAAQARQNLPSAPSAQKPVTVVNQVPITLQTAPVTSSSISSATAINNTTVKIDLGSQPPGTTPLYQRMSLWAPLIGVTLLASAAGIAAGLWLRPWQPDPDTPSSPFSPATVGGVQ